ncbi:hypothetical protein ACFPM7_07100 [Actinokineospora guangxiensis]|uniref:Uncharacterized protein n=1 Tax=Actinokineospora guangxiensis TaxID=1490288 RepID=A0ABW0EKG7_9PSEU
MTIVVRVLQALLLLAGLAAGIAAVTVGGMAGDRVGGVCYMRESPDPSSLEKVPSAGCATVGVYQAEAVSAVAIALAGIGAMVGAVAVGRMAPARAAAPRPGAAPHGYGPPLPQHQPGGPFPQQGPPTGQQPPIPPGQPYGPA